MFAGGPDESNGDQRERPIGERHALSLTGAARKGPSIFGTREKCVFLWMAPIASLSLAELKPLPPPAGSETMM